ncbi:MAG: TetR/AcrR family transcriptional regulator [Myxococcales bacterium]|nr:TetR/AcrR family transcriptional regulator [Myxococcales bacterium]
MTDERTSKGERTRAKLTAATAALLQRQGYHATGLAEIVAASGAPRGSLYFYFPDGKEALACAALEESGRAWRDRLEGVIARAPDLGAAITAVCDELAGALVDSDFRDGCPLATVALEASTTSEAVRATVAASYDAWLGSIAARVAALGVPAEVAARLATFTLAAIEGAMMLAKVQRSVAPLIEVAETLRVLTAMLAPGR